MTGEVTSFEDIVNSEGLAKAIVHKWNSWDSQRQGWKEEKKELRNFLFATDTTTTSNRTLPWKNTTTVPKLTQIRDNLHSNYLSALFPNDNWLKWEGYTLDAELREKRTAIEAYMANKVRESRMSTTVSQLLYDYIDYGNAFADVEYVKEYKTDEESGEQIPQYIGPRLVRIHPFDIVFNPLAKDFKSADTIVRKLKTLGELKKELEENPDNQYLEDLLSRSQELRKKAYSGTKEEIDKLQGLEMDGFGNYHEYLMSDVVELLEFEGDIYDSETGELKTGRVITVADRSYIARDEAIPSWLGKTKFHVGWRLRPDNLWAMGPLDNLVGMQYRIDHLENGKADAFDLSVTPMFKIYGDVEDFEIRPGGEIHIDEGGDVQILSPDASVLQTNFEIQSLMDRMELMAGAPREAMGIRTPGEKTATEVQQLFNAAGRIFQEKITHFEVNLLDPAMNAMLEVSRRNIDLPDTIRVMDDDLGVVDFLKVTKEDITAAGKLRPIGSRHFAAQQQLIQNLQMLFNSPVGQIIMPDVSTKQLARMVEDALQLERYGLFQENAQIFEQAQRQQIASQLQEELAVQQSQPMQV